MHAYSRASPTRGAEILVSVRATHEVDDFAPLAPLQLVDTAELRVEVKRFRVKRGRKKGWGEKG
jgi:hypothetical protein